MAKEQFTFEAEVSKLLDIVAHSLYSHKEIFLRELISNASDACDRRRYAALTQSDVTEPEGGFRISLAVDKKARTLTIADNGIGMSHDDLVDMLGTIARSGTEAFVEQLSGDSRKDVALIGKFGVGFYSSFMVAKKVEVLTRKAGEDDANLWASDGRGGFTIDAAERDAAGTSVTLYLNKGEDEFLETGRLEHIVKTYSDHISIPIVAADGEKVLNTASALWIRPPKDITEDQYKEFYHHVGHAFDDPWLTLHNRVEGVLSYTSLLFIPTTPSFDLFMPERRQHVKLYVNRVFITDDCEGLLPPYLRFLTGIVDSEDLPLNISREMLQREPRLAKIRAGLVKRVLGELKKKADKAPGDYAGFWDAFGAVLKEGIYEDFENRDKIIAVSRFRSTASDDLVSLDDYVGRMREGQEAIYYITGDDVEKLRTSPQLEGFKARGIEVLLLTDPVDEFWVPTVGNYAEKPFTSVTSGAVDLGKVAVAESDAAEKEKKDEQTDTPAIDGLVAAFKVALDGMVKDVRPSERLTDSPVCLVAAEGDIDIRLERLLKQHRRLGAADASLRILEVNPGHPLIARLADLAGGGNGDAALRDAALLLLDQARIVEGESVPDPTAFSRRLAAMMQKGLAA